MSKTETIRLFGPHVIVQLDPPRGQEGAVVLPESVDDRDPCWGVVTNVGNGRHLRDGSRSPVDVSVGDRVLVLPQHGITKQGRILRNSKRLGAREILIVEEDILCVET